MAKWEYLTVEVGDWGFLEAVLDGHGRDGWELVSVMKFPVGEIRMVFKRPLVEGE